MPCYIISSEPGVMLEDEDFDHISFFLDNETERVFGRDYERASRVYPAEGGKIDGAIRIILEHQEAVDWYTDMIPRTPPREGGYGYQFLRAGPKPYFRFRAITRNMRCGEGKDGADFFVGSLMRSNPWLGRGNISARCVALDAKTGVPIAVMLVKVSANLIPELESRGYEITSGLGRLRLETYISQPKPSSGVPGAGAEGGDDNVLVEEVKVVDEEMNSLDPNDIDISILDDKDGDDEVRRVEAAQDKLEEAVLRVEKRMIDVNKEKAKAEEELKKRQSERKKSLGPKPGKKKS